MLIGGLEMVTKNLTLDEFEGCVRDVAVAVVAGDDVYRVDCGSPGAFVVLDERDYRRLCVSKKEG